MRLHIAGAYWSYAEPRRLSCEGRPVDGLCILEPSREILVRRGLARERREETQLHELAHASNFSSAEHWVQVWSSGTARLLGMAGARTLREPGPRRGADVIRAVLCETLRIGRHDLDDDEQAQRWADEIARALIQLGWRA